jgi:hypothetical protein
MKTFVFVVLFCLASYSSSAQTPANPLPSQTAETPQQPTNAQVQDAVKALIICLVGSASEYDDHLSDASAIAQAIDGTCPTESSRLASVMSIGLTPDEAQRVQRGITNDLYSEALNSVLVERKLYAENHRGEAN